MSRGAITRAIRSRNTRINYYFSLRVFRIIFLVRLRRSGEVFRALGRRLVCRSPRLTRAVQVCTLYGRRRFQVLPRANYNFFNGYRMESRRRFSQDLALVRFRRLLMIRYQVNIFFTFPNYYVCSMASIDAPFLQWHLTTVRMVKLRLFLGVGVLFRAN